MKKRSLLLATLVSFTVLALGVGSAIAATISMSHNYSEGHVDVMLFNGSEDPKTDEDNIAEGDHDDHYVYANVGEYGSNVHAERHSGYVAEGNFAGIIPFTAATIQKLLLPGSQPIRRDQLPAIMI